MHVFNALRWRWHKVTRRWTAPGRAGPATAFPRTPAGPALFLVGWLLNAISENFHLAFVPLFALAYGASNSQVGWLTALGNLAGALALFPGAQAVERLGWRKPIVLWTGWGLGRLMLLALAGLPLLISRGPAAVWPSSPSMACGLLWSILPTRPGQPWRPTWSPALCAAVTLAAVIWPLASPRWWWSRRRLAHKTGTAGAMPHLGFQGVFFLAFAFGGSATPASGVSPNRRQRRSSSSLTAGATCGGR